MIGVTRGNQTFILQHEIFDKIISFLHPKNIARLLTVNNSWHNHLSSNELWIKLCPTISVEKANDGFYIARYPDLAGINLARNARIGNLQILKTISCHTSSIKCLKVNQKSIISGSYDTSIRIWDRAACLRSNAAILNACDLKPKYIEGHREGVIGIDVIDDKLAIIGFADSTVFIKDFESNIICTLIGHEDYVTCLEVNNKMIFSGSDDKTIRIWDQDGCLKKTLIGHQETVNCLQVIGETVISGSYDKTICIWDQNIESPRQVLSGHEGSVTCLKTTDTAIVSGSDDQTIRIWDLSNYKLQHTLIGHAGSVTCLEIIDDLIVSSSEGDGTMRIWDLTTGSLLHTFELKSSLACMKFIDNMLIAGSTNGDLQIWGYPKK